MNIKRQRRTPKARGGKGKPHLSSVVPKAFSYFFFWNVFLIQTSKLSKITKKTLIIKYIFQPKSTKAKLFCIVHMTSKQ